MDRTQPFEVPSGRPARGRVAAPPSKSHAIRALVCAVLAEGTSTLHGLSRCDADDVQRTIVALRTLGFTIDGDRVTGAGGVIPNPHVTLDLGGSGTAFRFLAAMATLGPGPTTLTGDASLRARPMDQLVLVLRARGASVEATDGVRGPCAPIVVRGASTGCNDLTIDTTKSSQVLSALLLIAPVTRHGLTLRPVGGRVSEGYVALTMGVLWSWGARIDVWSSGTCVRPGGYSRAEPFVIDGDWSSAAYMAAAAAVTGGDVEIDGVEQYSCQADERVADLLVAFGATVDLGDEDRTPEAPRFIGAARRPLDVDLRDAPDLAPLVGALGCVASGTTRVRGAAHLRIKESDRIATVVAAARALGCEATELPDGFEIVGPAKHGGLIVTQHDHRIAMAFAVAGLAIPGVVIDDPACVAKSYPGFWDDLARLTAG